MKGIEELIFAMKAGYPFFYIESQEVNKTIADISVGLETYFKTIPKNGTNYNIQLWDVEDGMGNYQNPPEMFNLLEKMEDGDDSIPPGRIVIAKNFNWYLVDEYSNCDKTLTSWLLNRAERFASPEARKILIIVGNTTFDKAVPEILKRDFANITFDLPTTEEIEKIYDFIIGSVKAGAEQDGNIFTEPDEIQKKRIIAGARGLTNSEIIKVYSYTIVKNKGFFDPKTVEELRSEELSKVPGLKIGKYNRKLSDLKGYDRAKEVASEWIKDPKAKGLMVLGPAGTGKTHFVQALAGEYDTWCVEADVAQMTGEGLVGQFEKAVGRVVAVLLANANPECPIVVIFDEIEKMLAGVTGAGNSGGSRDGGSTDRALAQLLKFLSEPHEGIYPVATCNDIEKLPAAWVRADRWDTAPIFVDLPNKEERESILEHYQKEYNITSIPADMTDWTGAEIKTWCKLAAKKISLGKNASEADELIVAVARTMSKEIDYLRGWAKGRTVPASRKRVKEQTTSTTRKLEV